MALFSKKAEELHECKLCGAKVAASNFVTDYEICNSCALLLDVEVQQLAKNISFLQEQANAAETPEKKISYLRLMLDNLYEYKVKYYDNEVDVLNQDVEELISEVVDCISFARL